MHRGRRSRALIASRLSLRRLSGPFPPTAARDALTGGWVVDVSELARLYPARPAEHSEALTEAVSGASHTTRDAPEIVELRARLDDALDQIQDLRRQRDRADEERRRAQEQLAGLPLQLHFNVEL
jgi:hypothetical protein